MVRKLEELEVYRLSEDLADTIWNICVRWDYFARSTVGKQMVTAADSIPSNISEGYGRYSIKENIHFCYFARGSLTETRNWVRRSCTRGLITNKDLGNIYQIADRLGPKLNAYMNSIRRQSTNQDFLSKTKA